MSTLIFDIETVGENWLDLDEVTQKVLTRWIDKTSFNESEKVARYEDVKNGLGFSPFTGFVVAIGLYDLERQQGVVYYLDEVESKEEVGGYILKAKTTEKDILEDFWEGAKHYNTFVTYNGRGFDAPFLIHRSLALGVLPSRNIMEGRYPSQQKTCRHVDLQDEMTWYGALLRKPSLHLVCRAYGIDSPKVEMGGDDVAELFRTKKFRDIARYNARDVTATTQLYQRWFAYSENINPDLDIDF